MNCITDITRRRQKHRLLFLCLAGLLAARSQIVRGVPVQIYPVESSVHAVEGHLLEAAVDGILTPENGWSLKEGLFKNEFVTFATDKPLTAGTFQFQFYFLSHEPGSYFGRFEIDVTTDEKPGLGARWMPLIPDLAVADCPTGARIVGAIIHIDTNCPVSILTVRTRAPFAGITGFRLKLFPVTTDPGSKHPPAIGCSADGSFTLTEFRVEEDPLRTSNIALNRQVFVGGKTASTQPQQNITDGFYSTFSRPDVNRMGQRFYFELDLGRSIALDHIVVRGREDENEANRLSYYRVEIGSEYGGITNHVNWRGSFHQDGSHPIGDADIIREMNGIGTFSGRDVRIYRTRDDVLQPQIAELEIYPALKPQARYWLADDKALSQGPTVVVPAGIRKLEFTIVSQAPEISQSALTYRWRIVGWTQKWHEVDADGRVALDSPPPPGKFQLLIQARHTDGIWDESGEPVDLQIALPWWHNPRAIFSLIGALAIVAAAVWWRIHVLLMKRRIAIAEKHLELHRERLRIARDMHDEIGARLTYIALLADRTSQETNGKLEENDSRLKQLAENARSVVGALDTIVWAVNPQHDSVGSFADYFTDYAIEYLKAADIQCQFDINIETPQRHVGLAVRHQLLMAVKEALRNVVKHAGATNVCFAFHEARGTISILVTDDGRGFLEKQGNRHPNGLNNMRHRLSEIGGECEIKTGSDGRGTCVCFKMTLEQTNGK